jgi:hypothetical protein
MRVDTIYLTEYETYEGLAGDVPHSTRKKATHRLGLSQPNPVRGARHRVPVETAA